MAGEQTCAPCVLSARLEVVSKPQITAKIKARAEKRSIHMRMSSASGAGPPDTDRGGPQRGDSVLDGALKLLQITAGILLSRAFQHPLLVTASYRFTLVIFSFAPCQGQRNFHLAVFEIKPQGYERCPLFVCSFHRGA